MPVHNRIAEFSADMAAWRQDLHAHPELGFEEHRTSAIVADKLASWGIEVHRGIAGTGVVGVLRGTGSSSRSIGIRADMDALAMPEFNEFAHRSRHPGKMHACGHDGHTTMLLGAARYLAETRNFDGTVVFIFQPAEEGGGGGRVMVEDGLFERFPCDSVYAAHNDPLLPAGTITAVPGPVMAAADMLEIAIRGRGGHAARPHHTVDPVLIGSHIIMALQSIVARKVDPLDSAVVGITTFHAGSAKNVIPETAELTGTVRTFRPQTQDEVEQLISRIVTSTAALHGGSAELRYERGYPPVVNSAEHTARAGRAAEKVVGAALVKRDHPPTMGGEDFSFMLLRRPGCFVRIGQKGKDKGGVPLHNSSYDFNDEIAPVGASFFSTLVEQELPRG
ncbi:MAG TPA: M20 aminoacylase family protein [Beijerinckiaceae bacterium]|nr:M20 aminoacylase family protein [Beijerinckiaceae bacterium]